MYRIACHTFTRFNDNGMRFAYFKDICKYKYTTIWTSCTCISSGSLIKCVYMSTLSKTLFETKPDIFSVPCVHTF